MSRASRNTVLLDMASQLPPIVVSRLLGVSIGTAARWANRAGTPQAGYAAELARRQELPKV